MPFAETDGLQVFQFSNLSSIPWLGYGISTSSLNVAIEEKRKFFFKTLGIRERNVVEAEQVHANHVAVVGEKEGGHLILATDGMITNIPGVALLIKIADCVPILLADPKNKVVGIIHAGWKGTVQEIARLTVNHMEDHFGTDPKNIVAGIGPSIGPCCYEVDTPVIEAFDRFPYKNKIFSRQKENKAHLNLWLANKFQLIDTGIKEENIEISKLCTFDNPELFFSERREKPTGRFGALIWIKE